MDDHGIQIHEYLLSLHRSIESELSRPYSDTSPQLERFRETLRMLKRLVYLALRDNFDLSYDS